MEDMATHSSIVAWKIPWTEESGGLQSMGLRSVKHDGSSSAHMLSHVQLFATPRTVACQTPLSMEFSKQENWNRLPCPPPGDPLDPGIKPTSLASPELAGRFFTTEPAGKPPFPYTHKHCYRLSASLEQPSTQDQTRL